MGNWSSAVILDEPIEHYGPRLYWPSVPYEGPVKLRFHCSSCQSEAILLEPFPVKWRDIVHLRGQCFQCERVRTIQTKFVEAAKARLAIYTFDGRDERVLAAQIQKFIRSGPPAPQQSLEEGELYYQLTVRPENWRVSTLPPDFLFPENISSQDLKARRKQFYNVASKHIRTRESLVLQIHRHNLLADACKQFLAATPEQLRGTLKVNFVDEEAIDWGGVTREFFSVVSQSILDPRVNLFLPTGPNSTFHPSFSSSINDVHLDYYRFFGRFLGKALLDKRLVKAPLTRALFKLILGKPLGFSDFQTVDKTTSLRLQQTLEFDTDTLDSCSFVFAVDMDDFDKHGSYVLKDGGEDIAVTKENVYEWMRLLSAWKMVGCVREQIEQLLFGFYEIIPVTALSLFNEFELEQLLCGLPEIDVEDWRKHSVVVGFSRSSRERGEWFWEIMSEFSNERRGQVLQFATGSAQVPVSFEHFFPPFYDCFY